MGLAPSWEARSTCWRFLSCKDTWGGTACKRAGAPGALALPAFGPGSSAVCYSSWNGLRPGLPAPSFPERRKNPRQEPGPRFQNQQPGTAPRTCVRSQRLSDHAQPEPSRLRLHTSTRSPSQRPPQVRGTHGWLCTHGWAARGADPSHTKADDPNRPDARKDMQAHRPLACTRSPGFPSDLPTPVLLITRKPRVRTEETSKPREQSGSQLSPRTAAFAHYVHCLEDGFAVSARPSLFCKPLSSSCGYVCPCVSGSRRQVRLWPAC